MTIELCDTAYKFFKLLRALHDAGSGPLMPALFLTVLQDGQTA
jgi:hypothetical protein